MKKLLNYITSCTSTDFQEIRNSKEFNQTLFILSNTDKTKFLNFFLETAKEESQIIFVLLAMLDSGNKSALTWAHKLKGSESSIISVVCISLILKSYLEENANDQLCQSA
jgi:hypothetical protein